MRTFGARLLLALAVTVIGMVQSCSSENKDAEESKQDKIDKLRSLPYLSFTDEEATDENSGTIYYDPKRSHPGYNMYTVRDLSMAVIVDAQGQLVNEWRGTQGRWARCTLLPNGDIMAIGLDEGGRYAVRQSWNGEQIWRISGPAHHDIGLTPDGRVMALTLASVRVPEKFPQPIRDDRVTIFANDGTVADELSLFEAMASGGFEFQHVAPKEGYIDLFHANSVMWQTHENLYGRDPIYDEGNVIVCTRHQDTVAIFDFAQRKLLWSWGQDEISGPHDAQFLDSGNLLIFDNGVGRDWSRVIELDPLTKEIVWEYKAPNPSDFYTTGRGANQRLANGNTLITQSETGRAFEVTPDGEIVWEYLCPASNEAGKRATFVRLYRYDTEMIDRIIRSN